MPLTAGAVSVIWGILVMIRLILVRLAVAAYVPMIVASADMMKRRPHQQIFVCRATRKQHGWEQHR